MTPSETSKFIEACLDARQPAMIWGSPGIGKSDIMLQIAKRKGKQLIDIRANLFDPIDLRGLPNISPEGLTSWAIPDFLPREGEGILFIDELPNAPQAVQVSFYQLILDRALGDYALPDGWDIFAAGNRMSDKGATHAMPAPLANRFVHAEVEPNLDDFVDWALTTGKIDNRIIAFLRFRTDLLNAFDPKFKAFPTPRSWEMLSKLLNHTPSEIQFETFSGTVGEGAATEFTGFLRIVDQLPDLDSLIQNPDTTRVPDTMQAQYAVATGLATRANPETFPNIIKYITKLPAEFQVITVKDSLRLNNQLAECRAFINWSIKNASILL